ncbi:MAG: hypothetical protein K6T83_06765 [Alicyclobacillus sp.]|nr:hypothetical protein [Alicyclobacillus sp.]
MSLDEKFRQYHEDNPHVYATLVRLAREMKAKGYTHIGIGMIWETMRYQMLLTTHDPEGWKLNNNYRSRYARLIMQQEPDLDGIFEIRELRSSQAV